LTEDHTKRWGSCSTFEEIEFGKRKYKIADIQDGAWILVEVELRPERKCFLVKVEDISAAT
jgi:hypothetical protein